MKLKVTLKKEIKKENVSLEKWTSIFDTALTFHLVFF